MSRYYAEGKLGGRKQVVAELEHDTTTRGFGDSFFDKRGRLIPYSKLAPRQKIAFDSWMYGARVDAIAGVHRKLVTQIPRIDAECGSS